MSPLRSMDVAELRGVEARSVSLLRALAVHGHQNLAGAVDTAMRAVRIDPRSAMALATIGNVTFERALNQHMPQPGMVTPRPLGPLDLGTLDLLIAGMIAADASLPYALTESLLAAGIVGGGQRASDLGAKGLRQGVEAWVARVTPPSR